MTKRSVFAVSAVAGGILLIALKSSVGSVTPAPDTRPRAKALIQKIVRTPLFDDLSYPARIESRVNTTILAETDGYVSRLFAPLGSSVQRHGQLLEIRQTDPVYQFSPLIVRSPVRGVVSQVDVTEGTQVAKGQKLGAITDPAQVRIVIEVPSLDLMSLKQGMGGKFQLEGSDATITVKISGISPFVDPATGTATCMLEVGKNSGLTLRPGALGQASFRTNERLGISLPEHAIVYLGADPLVRIVENGKVHKIPVKLGRRQSGYIEILSGIQDGQSYVERISRFVSDGEAVDPDDGDGT